MARPRFRQLPHTADIRLAAWGGTPDELLENAVAGALHSAMLGPASLPVAAWHRLPGRPHTLPDQVVSAINEALFLLYARRTLTVALRTKGDGGIELGVAPLPSGRFPAREIKAATFHGLSAGRSGGRLRAMVLLDL